MKERGEIINNQCKLRSKCLPSYTPPSKQENGPMRRGGGKRIGSKECLTPMMGVVGSGGLLHFYVIIHYIYYDNINFRTGTKYI